MEYKDPLPVNDGIPPQQSQAIQSVCAPDGLLINDQLSIDEIKAAIVNGSESGNLELVTVSLCRLTDSIVQSHSSSPECFLSPDILTIAFQLTESGDPFLITPSFTLLATASLRFDALVPEMIGRGALQMVAFFLQNEDPVIFRPAVTFATSFFKSDASALSRDTALPLDSIVEWCMPRYCKEFDFELSQLHFYMLMSHLSDPYYAAAATSFFKLILCQPAAQSQPSGALAWALAGVAAFLSKTTFDEEELKEIENLDLLQALINRCSLFPQLSAQAETSILIALVMLCKYHITNVTINWEKCIMLLSDEMYHSFYATICEHLRILVEDTGAPFPPEFYIPVTAICQFGSNSDRMAAFHLLLACLDRGGEIPADVAPILLSVMTAFDSDDSLTIEAALDALLSFGNQLNTQGRIAEMMSFFDPQAVSPVIDQLESEEESIVEKTQLLLANLGVELETD